jgi:LPXTG-motif cell wall-anchored protein
MRGIQKAVKVLAAGAMVIAGLALAPTAASADDVPAPAGTCVQGHIVGTGQHCYTPGYSDPKDAPKPGVIIEPTAAQCAIFRQQVADGKGTLVALMLAAGLDATGCPPPGSGTCVLGHDTVTGEHCYTPGYSDPKDAPKPGAAACDTSKIDGDGDYDCTPFPASALATGSSGGAPAVAAPAAADPAVAPAKAATPAAAPAAEVKGVAVTNPAAKAAAAPLSQPALAAAAAPAATAKALPLTGGDISGIVLIAFAGLGIGGALLLIDKRRRTA